ncbi:uncharacterized protein LOC135842501 [Planococcus citri]|uniref:uncharacterized protein LOC135842501 n=1 Tax=Planococcus citri TaxID=170843 RepID=UPI0031FA0EE3
MLVRKFALIFKTSVRQTEYECIMDGSTLNRISYVVICYILVEFLFLIFAEKQMYHHSSAGDYYVEWKAIGACPADKRGTNEIWSDIHLTKKHRKTELVGNLTFLVPLDDNTPMKLDFAILGSNAAWLPNAYSMTLPKGCSGFMSLLREGLVEYLKSFGMPPKCPMQKGFYQTKGFDPDKLLLNPLIPKQFIYGRYKLTVEYFNRKNSLVGCTYFVLDILPLWQKNEKTKSR